jgi:hypothetical protein
VLADAQPGAHGGGRRTMIGRHPKTLAAIASVVRQLTVVYELTRPTGRTD